MPLLHIQPFKSIKDRLHRRPFPNGTQLMVLPTHEKKEQTLNLTSAYITSTSPSDSLQATFPSLVTLSKPLPLPQLVPLPS